MAATPSPGRQETSWRTPWRDLVDMAACGGAVVETRDPSQRRLVARTLTQLDGDVVTYLWDRIDQDKLDAHFAEVRRRLEAARAPVRRITAAFLALSGLSGVAVFRLFSADLATTLAGAVPAMTAAYFARHVVVGTVLRGCVGWTRLGLARKGRRK